MVNPRWWLGLVALLAVVWLGVACSDGGPTVTPAVQSVTVTPTEAVIAVEQTLPLTATVEVTGGASKNVSWSSSDEGVATVDAAGVVTGVTPGTAEITATSAVDAAKAAAAAITVEQIIEADDTAALREAVADAPAGTVIVLRAGVYELTETLRVELDRELRGSPGTILRLVDAATIATAEAAPWADYGRPVLYAEGVTLRLSDVELEYAGEADATVVALIDVDGDFRNVRVRGGTSMGTSALLGHGIVARDATLRLEGVEVSGNDRIGVRLVSTVATLADVTVSSNGAVGMIALEESVVTATRITASGNAGAGLGAAGNAQMAIREATVAANGTVGIYVLTTASIALTDVVVQDHAGGGLEVHDQARATVIGGLLQRNSVGITTSGDAVARVEGAALLENDWVGAWATGASRLTLVDVDASATGDHGVLAVGTATLVVEGGRFAESRRQGMTVTGEASATITGATAEGNRTFGVLFDERAQARMTESVVTDNGFTGIEIGSESDAVLEDNRITGNGYAGIAVVGAATATGRGNEMSGNVGPGLSVHGGEATFEANVIIGNATEGGAGVLFLGGATAVLNGNEIADHPGGGIAVQQVAAVEVVDNLVRDNGSFGIAFHDEAGGRVDGNTIRGNGHCGIYPGALGNVMIGNNVFEGNAGADVCPTVAVTITPTAAVLQAGQAAAFRAQVYGSDDPRVTWWASCGAVEGLGASIDYRAPVTGESRCTLTATSVASPGSSAVADIAVTRIEIAIDGITFAPAQPATLAIGSRVRVDWSWTSNIVGPYQVCALVERSWTGCIPQSARDGSATSEFWSNDEGMIDEVQLMFMLDGAPYWRLGRHVVPVTYAWSEQVVELFGYIGTSSRPDAPLMTNLSLVVRGPPRSSDETITVTVTGPATWGTHEFDLPWSAGRRTTGIHWRQIWREPVSGAYEVTASVDGELLSSTVTIDASMVLPAPSGETLIRSTVNELALSWDPVPGAGIFEVQFNEAGGNVHYQAKTTTPEADYSHHSLNLDPTKRHIIRILATSIDLQPAFDWTEQPPPLQQVNSTSSRAVCFYPGDEAFSDCR